MMNLITSYIRRQFPECHQMSTDQAKVEILDNPAADNILVIDSRRLDEYQVSKIPGAVHLNFKCSDEELKNALADVQADIKILCYCSLGYRSCIMAKRIMDMETMLPVKPESVFNLEGSIFKWANEDKPLVDHQGNPTKY